MGSSAENPEEFTGRTRVDSGTSRSKIVPSSVSGGKNRNRRAKIGFLPIHRLHADSGGRPCCRCAAIYEGNSEALA